MVQKTLYKEEYNLCKNVKKGMELFGDKDGPSIIMGFDVYKEK
jgi:hypothetical protein